VLLLQTAIFGYSETDCTFLQISTAWHQYCLKSWHSKETKEILQHTLNKETYYKQLCLLKVWSYVKHHVIFD